MIQWPTRLSRTLKSFKLLPRINDRHTRELRHQYYKKKPRSVKQLADIEQFDSLMLEYTQKLRKTDDISLIILKLAIFFFVLICDWKINMHGEIIRNWKTKYQY